MVLFAIVVPLAANVVWFLGFGPTGDLDLTPVAFTLSGLAFTVAIYRHHLLDVAPVARTAVIEHDSRVRSDPDADGGIGERGEDTVHVRVGTRSGGFFVEDDGPGIPAGERERVLDRDRLRARDRRSDRRRTRLDARNHRERRGRCAVRVRHRLTRRRSRS